MEKQRPPLPPHHLLSFSPLASFSKYPKIGPQQSVFHMKIGDPSMTPNRLLAQVFLPSLLLSGCGSLCSCDSFQKLEKIEKNKTIHRTKVGKLVVTSRNGYIHVSKGSSSDFEIRASVRARTMERAKAVQIHAAPTKNGDFEIYAVFPDKQLSKESCSFTIKIPSTQALSLQTSNGAIYLNRLKGPAHLHTSNGRIQVFGHRGPLDLSTSNGSIQVRDADTLVEAHSSNGKIDVSLHENNPGPVRLRTSNGRIQLKVGKAFQGTLLAHTGNGLVRADLPQEIRTFGKKRREMQIQFSKKGQASNLTSSNGSIRVERM